MRVNTHCGEVVFYENRFDLRNPIMPDPETGGRTSNVGAIITPRACTWVYPNANLATGYELAKTL